MIQTDLAPREISPEELTFHLAQLRNAQPPIPSMTWDEYREYQSWRIEVQMIAVYLHDWRIAKEEDKPKCLPMIQKSLEAANQRATRFPKIPMPEDIVNPVASAWDHRAPNASEAHLRLPTMIQELTCLFGSVQLDVGTTKTEGDAP